MDFAANFTAIDFETASRRGDSACQLAAVQIRDGQICKQSMWMIRPIPCHFSPRNIEIHGITPQAVQGECVFGELWGEIANEILGDVLVAHNASFDINVLLACLRAHDLSIPSFEFTCTRAIARQVWQHRQRFGLQPLADWLGIRFKHHDALEDSVACAKVLLAAGIDREATTLEELETSLRLSRGTAGPWGYRGPTKRSSRKRSNKSANAQSSAHASEANRVPKSHLGRRQEVLPFLFPDGSRSQDKPAVQESTAQFVTEKMQSGETRSSLQANSSIDLQRLLIRAEFIRPLIGRQVVICGRLQFLSHDDAEALATKLGGSCQTDVDESTDYLVVGTNETNRYQKLASQRSSLEIVTEEEFLGLLVS